MNVHEFSVIQDILVKRSVFYKLSPLDERPPTITVELHTAVVGNWLDFKIRRLMVNSVGCQKFLKSLGDTAILNTIVDRKGFYHLLAELGVQSLKFTNIAPFGDALSPDGEVPSTKKGFIFTVEVVYLPITPYVRVMGNYGRTRHQHLVEITGVDASTFTPETHQLYKDKELTQRVHWTPVDNPVVAPESPNVRMVHFTDQWGVLEKSKPTILYIATQ